MSTGDWNFLAGRLTGDGNIEITETDLPIEIDSIDRKLGEPKTLSGSITNRVKRLQKDGKPVFEPWNTVVIATVDDNIRGMGIYREPSFNGEVWDLDVAGFGCYPQETLYDGTYSKVDVDPLTVWRHIWDHIQSQPGGNIGVVLDRETTSPSRIGTVEEPYKLNYWDNLDLYNDITALSQDAPFDWVERDRWNADGEPECYLEAGHPEIGRIVKEGGIILGVNLETTPAIGAGGAATDVWVYGPGEGSARIRGYAGLTSPGRVRRTKVIDDPTARTTTTANARAARALARSQAVFTVDSVDIVDHPSLRIDTIELGNQYRLYAETPHATVDQFVRVVGISENPLVGGRATLTVVSAEVA